MNCRAVFACLGLTLSLTACATHKPPKDEPIPADALVLEVENHNWSDVQIYMLHDGSRTRFMQVTATQSATQIIPASMVSSNGTVQVQVHRIGGHDDTFAPVGGPQFATARDDYLSPVVSIRTGRTVELTLESDLNRSSVGVW